MGTRINNKQLKEEFEQIIPKYQSLLRNLESDFSQLLKDEGIKYELFTGRIKEFDNFFEKVRRKKYEKPFEENHDFCGFRIVCFYLSDLQRISDIIRNNFDVFSEEDKIEDLDVDHFGYRSRHYIVKLMDKWLEYPKLKHFSGMKFEIQVRTLNMHSWGQASHGLDYKNEDMVPKQLRRKLFMASAFLEMADTIFEDLRKEIDILMSRTDVLTIHSLKKYLQTKFPSVMTEGYKVIWLFMEMKEAGISIQDIDDGYEILKDDLIAVERELAGKWMSTGCARAILDITNDRFFTDKFDSRSDRWYNGVIAWREKIKNKMP